MGGTLAVRSEIGVGSVFIVKVKAEIDKNERDRLRVSYFLGLKILQV